MFVLHGIYYVETCSFHIALFEDIFIIVCLIFHVAFLHLLEWLNNTYSLFYMIYHIYWFASIDYCVLYKSHLIVVYEYFCWIWFAYILLRTFASMCIKNSDLCFLCVYMYFLALVFGNTGFVKRFGRTFLYSIFLKDYEKGK